MQALSCIDKDQLVICWTELRVYRPTIANEHRARERERESQRERERERERVYYWINCRSFQAEDLTHPIAFASSSFRQHRL